MRLTQLLSVLALAAASSLLAAAAKAQNDPSGYEPIRLETLSEAFNSAFFEESGDFYRNRSTLRQIGYIIGPGLPGRAGFPELEIERDAKRINTLYRDALEQQVSSDPIIRTPDLPNPFNSTLRQVSGVGRFGTRLEGSEFIYPTVVPPQ
ncbi:MAG TPA: hypothetical protein V6D37_03195 [Candidatus Sericytochromatia bacterium]|jgi:hypothetical protein